MRKKKQETVSTEGQPQPQIVYVREQKKGGCFSTMLKGFGFLMLLFIGIAIVGAMTSGGGDEDTNPPARSADGTVINTADEVEIGSGENPAPIGTTITRDGLEITFHSVSESDTAGVLTSYEQGWEYLTIDATIRNVSDETKDFNYLYFFAKDIDQGYTYDDDPFAGNPDATLGSGDLSPNDLVRGEVVLKVRTEGSNIRIKYDNAVFGGANLYWLYAR